MCGANHRVEGGVDVEGFELRGGVLPTCARAFVTLAPLNTTLQNTHFHRATPLESGIIFSQMAQMSVALKSSGVLSSSFHSVAVLSRSLILMVMASVPSYKMMSSSSRGGGGGRGSEAVAGGSIFLLRVGSRGFFLFSRGSGCGDVIPSARTIVIAGEVGEEGRDTTTTRGGGWKGGAEIGKGKAGIVGGTDGAGILGIINVGMEEGEVEEAPGAGRVDVRGTAVDGSRVEDGDVALAKG